MRAYYSRYSDAIAGDPEFKHDNADHIADLLRIAV